MIQTGEKSLAYTSLIKQAIIRLAFNLKLRLTNVHILISHLLLLN
jgi:hypothetical protein